MDSDEEENLDKKIKRTNEKIPWYTDCERETLTNLVTKYGDILLKLKKSNTPCIIDKKRKTWTQLTKEYNEHPDVRKVTTIQLQRHWSNLLYRKAVDQRDQSRKEDSLSDSEQLIEIDIHIEDTNLHKAIESIIEEAKNDEKNDDIDQEVLLTYNDPNDEGIPSAANKTDKKNHKKTHYQHTDLERETLIDLVKKYGNILLKLSRETSLIEEKKTKWIQLTQEYNEHPGVRKLTTHQLQRHWTNLLYRKVVTIPNRSRKKTKTKADVKKESTTFESIIYPATNDRTYEDETPNTNVQSYEEMPHTNVQQSFEELLTPKFPT